MKNFDISIPSRFLATMGHFIVICMAFSFLEKSVDIDIAENESDESFNSLYKKGQVLDK